MVLGLQEACTSQGGHLPHPPRDGIHGTHRLRTSYSSRMLPRGTWRESEREREAVPDSVHCAPFPGATQQLTTFMSNRVESGESILRTYYGTDGRPTLCLGRSTLSWEVSTTHSLLLWEQEAPVSTQFSGAGWPRNTGMHTARMHRRAQFPGLSCQR